MGIFSRAKKPAAPTEKAAPASSGKQAVAPSAPVKSTLTKHAGDVLSRPRITEKAGLLGGANVYVFDINPSATKGDVARAVSAAFKVTPVAVRTVTIRGKVVTTRGTGKRGRTAGGKKAYVTLKEGDTIELM